MKEVCGGLRAQTHTPAFLKPTLSPVVYLCSYARGDSLSEKQCWDTVCQGDILQDLNEFTKKNKKKQTSHCLSEERFSDPYSLRGYFEI